MKFVKYTYDYDGGTGTEYVDGFVVYDLYGTYLHYSAEHGETLDDINAAICRVAAAAGGEKEPFQMMPPDSLPPPSAVSVDRMDAARWRAYVLHTCAKTGRYADFVHGVATYMVAHPDEGPDGCGYPPPEEFQRLADEYILCHDGGGVVASGSPQAPQASARRRLSRVTLLQATVSSCAFVEVMSGCPIDAEREAKRARLFNAPSPNDGMANLELLDAALAELEELFPLPLCEGPTT